MDMSEKKLELKGDVEKMRYEGLESMTRKQVDEVEKNVNSAQSKYDRNKEKLERINKALVSSKAGIEHLSEKLNDIKLEGIPNVAVTDNTLVEALIQCEQKLEYVYGSVRYDPLYEEAIQRIRGQKKEEEFMPESIGNRLMASTLMVTGFGGGAGAGAASGAVLHDPTTNNIRVKLPDKDDDELSEVDNDAEKDLESNERMKIKLEAQLRYDRMAKNKVKNKAAGGGSSGGVGASSLGNSASKSRF